MANTSMIPADRDKFQVMFLSPLLTTDPYFESFTFSDIEIQLYLAKLLSIIVDDKFNFNEPVHTLCTKAAQLFDLYQDLNY